MSEKKVIEPVPVDEEPAFLADFQEDKAESGPELQEEPFVTPKGFLDSIFDALRAILADVPVSNTEWSIELDKKAEGTNLNWRASVVDFLTLLKIDSSAEGRDALAQELGVTIGASGSAERNEALRVAVFNKVRDNGGNVPASLND